MMPSERVFYTRRRRRRARGTSRLSRLLAGVELLEHDDRGDLVADLRVRRPAAARADRLARGEGAVDDRAALHRDDRDDLAAVDELDLVGREGLRADRVVGLAVVGLGDAADEHGREGLAAEDAAVVLELVALGHEHFLRIPERRCGTI